MSGTADLTYVPVPEDSDPHAHQDKVADTGDAYVAHKGWLLVCLWCPEYVFAPTKSEAAAKMQYHYDVACGSGQVIIR